MALGIIIFLEIIRMALENIRMALGTIPFLAIITMTLGMIPFLPIILPFINQIINSFIAFVKRQASYAFKHHSHVKKLQDKAKDLDDKRERLKQSVDEATRNGKEIHENATRWLTDADEIIVEAEELINREEQAIFGLFPSLKTRYQLSKNAEKKALAIDRLMNEQGLDPVYFSLPPKQITAPSVYSSENLQSRVSILKQVMDALKDSSLYVIGVYGMGGVGKTTLAKEVHRQAQIDKLFDIVVMVAVSQSPEIRKIQKVIAEVLGLDLQEEGMLLRANKLCERLKKEKKILIILDDVWKQLQLEEVGIPFGKDHKGCKLFITSRRPDVCRAMGANKNFGVEVLSDEESWSLFKMTVADGEDHPKLPPIATEVANRCSGLPLLILIVAKDLRNKEPDEWNHKLSQLSAFDNEDIQEKVHRVLETSYYNLPSNEVKSFFLLCGLFGQSNIWIHQLLEYSMGLGLFKHITSVEDARKRVNRLIRDLKAEILLLDGDMDGFVKMHDVVRDTAMSIASKVQHAFIGISGFGVREWQTVEDCTRISLPYCDIEELPVGLEYPKAELLLLFTEDFSLKIPDLFFERIRKLKVVDLTGMFLATLPSSLGVLANIHTLCLYQCQLNDIAIIGELKQLEVLSFAGSYLVELPRKIEQLTRLKLLDLRNCFKLQVIPANVLSKLSMLEELYMSNSFVQWDAEGINYNKGNASLSELEELSHLSTLELKVIDAEMIPKTLFFSGLQRYTILIGKEWRWCQENYEISKTLKVKLLSSNHLEQGVKVLLKESEDLHLDKVRGIDTVLSDVDSEGFPRLKNLYINNDLVIQHIINSTKFAQHHAFPILESLYLYNLKSLKQMCHGQLVSGSFSKLTTLEVMGCHSLTNLFSFSTAESLPQLKQLKVSQCSNMKYIVIGESGEKDEMLELTQLCTLMLHDLPNLRNFFSNKADPKFEASESHSQGASSSLFEKVHFPNLEKLDLYNMASEKIWENQQLSTTSWNLRFLCVTDCNNLKHLFTMSMLEKSFLLLEFLKVASCENMEEIILTDEEFVGLSMPDKMVVFPHLNYLDLRCLPKLITFCRGHFIEFQSLRKLNICSVKFTSFISKAAHAQEATQETNQTSEIESLFNEMVAFPKLEVMELRNMDYMESIWHNQLAADSFSKLKSLSVEYCRKLSAIFPLYVLERLQRLEKLKLLKCQSVLEVYQLQGFNEDVKLVFELRDLLIENMLLLKHIWSKDTPQGVVSFQNLQSIVVDDCKDLKNIFPASIARDLPKLETLKLKRCGVEKIVAMEKEPDAPCFILPQLSSVLMADLPHLTSFYPGRHTSEWPNLKSMEVYNCDNVMKFGSEIYGHKEAPGESPPPLFLLEKVNHNLEELTLEDRDLMVIESSNLFPVERFSNLKVVTLLGLGDERRLLRKRFNNLDNLIVSDGPIKEELFSHEGLIGEEQLVCVKHLVLQNLYYLKHIWKQDYRLKPLLDYLQTLRLESCLGLINIAPSSSSSFKNLSTLDVSLCENLINLVTLSTAKTMMRLTKLTVYYCPNMTEIVANDEGNQTQDEIIFRKLKSLELCSLFSLTSFCSGNYTFSFPSLEQVTVYQCSEMKIFSFGALSTPMLRSIQVNMYNENEQEWEGNLNATIASLKGQ